MSIIEDKSKVVPAYTEENLPPASVSRRNFLKIAGAFIATSSIGIAGACNAETAGPQQSPELQGTVDNIYPEVPVDPMLQPRPSILKVFSVHEAKTVEALTARILPGTPADPGAREAGVVTYIDNMLSFSEGFNEPTYRQPPFAETYEGDIPPVTGTLPGQYQVVYVKKEELPRYGFQSIMTPRETYRLGVMALDQYAQSKFNANFVDLTEDQQDQIVGDLSNDKAKTFTAPSGSGFFKMERTDTINGMFSDPGYGGNNNMVGWLLIGYPGAQRAYTALDIVTEAPPRAPQSLAQMHLAHPGQLANPDVILPQSGNASSDMATMQGSTYPLVQRH
ncbi:MAG: gluconate 2-dehydrogenase subunit 3 family protein [Aggregatilineales bacterium]